MLSTTEELHDQNGISLPLTTYRIRLDDYLMKTSTDETFDAATGGAATTITIYSILTIVIGVVFNKSLNKLWSMLNSIQYFYFIKFINYSWPWIIYNSLNYYSLVTLQKEPGYVR